MTAPDNLYSRFIAWSKILLPLAALALLSTMFLFARRSDTTGEIPFARIEDIARSPRIASPSFAGIAQDGAVFTVTADTIRPVAGQPDAFAIADFRADVTNLAGDSLTLTAAEGAFDGRARTITLTGLARLTTSTGYAMETTGLTAWLDLNRIESAGALAVRAPFGMLTAARMAYGPGPNGPQMVFNGGVRLLYEPDTTRSVP